MGGNDILQTPSCVVLKGVCDEKNRGWDGFGTKCEIGILQLIHLAYALPLAQNSLNFFSHELTMEFGRRRRIQMLLSIWPKVDILVSYMDLGGNDILQTPSCVVLKGVYGEESGG